jgi:hypothetical protein
VCKEEGVHKRAPSSLYRDVFEIDPCSATMRNS